MSAKTKISTVSPAAQKATKPAVAPAVSAAPVTSVTPVAKPIAAPIAAAPMSAPVKPAAPAAKTVTPAERQKMIEVAAHALAEKNGHQGDAQKYWLQAEKEVDAKLGKK